MCPALCSVIKFRLQSSAAFAGAIPTASVRRASALIVSDLAPFAATELVLGAYFANKHRPSPLTSFQPHPL
jgi:hypothetical protein